MILSEVLTNDELRHREFPVSQNKIFLGHAGVCPLPRRVAQAMTDCANGGTLGDQEAFVMHRLADARKLGAQLLNGDHHRLLLRQESIAQFSCPIQLVIHHGEHLRKRHERFHAQIPIRFIQCTIELISL